MKKNQFFGIIGNGQTCALINPMGSIEWLCIPRFDSPFVFGRIIDHESGFWTILPLNIDIHHWSQNYILNTAILETNAYNSENQLLMKMTDWMPRGRTEIHRSIQLNSSSAEKTIKMYLKPTFNYRLSEHEWESQEHEVDLAKYCIVTAASDVGKLHLILPSTAINLQDLKIKLNSLKNNSLELILNVTNPIELILTYSTEIDLEHNENPVNITKDSFQQEITYWEKWLAQSKYSGKYLEIYNRSLITMKILTYDPSGAMVAAGTTSIPQHPGGGSNWDYRFLWIRDGGYGAAAFAEAGFYHEAQECIDFCFSVIATEGKKPWQPLYRIDGDPDCTEQILTHLSGYFGDGPVRIGNLAAEQIQNDLEGEVLDSLWILYEHTKSQEILEKHWEKIIIVADYVSKHWQDTDNGIWELRGVLGNYVHSKVMCWLALDRASKIAHVLKHESEERQWLQTAEIIQQDVLIKGWNRKMKSFTLAYNAPITDTSVLTLPLTEFIDSNHEYNRFMIKRVEKELVYDHLVARNIFETAPFPLVTFWLARCYMQMNEQIKAQAIIERSLELLTDLGLYCEHAVSAEDQGKPSRGTIVRALGNLVFAHENLKSLKEFFQMLKLFYKHRKTFKEETEKPILTQEQAAQFRGNFPQLYSHEELVRTLLQLK